MVRAKRARAKRDPARQVLTMGVSFLGIAALLFLVSLGLGSGGSGMLKPVAQGLRTPIPFLLGIGLVLLAVHAWLRGRPPAPAKSNPHPFSHEKAIDPVVERPLEAVSRPSQPPGEDPARMPPADWTSKVFREIEWRRFEAVCAALFAQAGFEARSQSHGADGGVDMWLHSKNAEGPVAVVQCKHWLGKPVGVKEMREFYGVMAASRLSRGTYATSSTFTADARAFAKDNGISALDGDALLALIHKRTPEQQVELLLIAHEGEYWRPTCASCGTKMVEREARKTGSAFWGCTNYPRCRSTLPLRSVQ